MLLGCCCCCCLLSKRRHFISVSMYKKAMRRRSGLRQKQRFQYSSLLICDISKVLTKPLCLFADRTNIKSYFHTLFFYVGVTVSVSFHFVLIGYFMEFECDGNKVKVQCRAVLSWRCRHTNTLLLRQTRRQRTHPVCISEDTTSGSPHTHNKQQESSALRRR